MKRRALLAVVAGSIGGAAGCTRDDSASISDQPFSEYDCPPVEGSDAPTCSHTVDTEQADVYLLASPKTSPDPSEITVTLTNEAEQAIEFNPYSWDLWVERSGSWRRIEQRGVGHGYANVKPGGAHRWSLADIREAIRDDLAFDPGTYFATLAMEVYSPACLFRITKG